MRTALCTTVGVIGSGIATLLEALEGVGGISGLLGKEVTPYNPDLRRL